MPDRRATRFVRGARMPGPQCAGRSRSPRSWVAGRFARGSSSGLSDRSAVGGSSARGPVGRAIRRGRHGYGGGRRTTAATNRSPPTKPVRPPRCLTGRLPVTPVLPTGRTGHGTTLRGLDPPRSGRTTAGAAARSPLRIETPAAGEDDIIAGGGVRSPRRAANPGARPNQAARRNMAASRKRSRDRQHPDGEGRPFRLPPEIRGDERPQNARPARTGDRTHNSHRHLPPAADRGDGTLTTTATRAYRGTHRAERHAPHHRPVAAPTTAAPGWAGTTRNADHHQDHQNHRVRAASPGDVEVRRARRPKLEGYAGRAHHAGPLGDQLWQIDADRPRRLRLEHLGRVMGGEEVPPARLVQHRARPARSSLVRVRDHDPVGRHPGPGVEGALSLGVTQHRLGEMTSTTSERLRSETATAFSIPAGATIRSGRGSLWRRRGRLVGTDHELV